MTYAELAVMQASRAKTFSAAQTDAMAAYCQAEHDLKELQAENAKLHAELTDLRLGSCPSCGIKVENERLREMCRDLVGELRGLGIDFTRVSWCEYADELRELGIEVDA